MCDSGGVASIRMSSPARQVGVRCRTRVRAGLCFRLLPSVGLAVSLLLGALLADSAAAASPPAGQALPSPQALAPEGPTFRTEAKLVRVDVQVERKGTPVAGLSARDFVVKDQGKPVELAAFASEAAPLDLILLVDVSGSMRNAVAEMVRTAEAALHELEPGDRVALIAFTSAQALIEEFTTNRNRISVALARLTERRMRGGTALYPAIRAAANYAADPKAQVAGESRRRAIVMVTDNLSQRERAQERETIRALWEADAVLHGLVIPVAGSFRLVDSVRMPWTQNREDIRRVVKQTGGEVVEVEKVEREFPAMLRRARLRYILYYRAPQADPGEYRRIEVELAREARQRTGGKATIRTRPGYYAR